MPITLRQPIRRLSQAEFGELAYSVMGCVFQIHQNLGRFFDEKIYKRELAHRHPGVQLEVPIEVTHATFKKLQYIDVLVDNGGPLEFKTVEALTPRHSAQLLHYMLLAELGHGKLVNLRKESVEHEFANTTLTLQDRTRFKVSNSKWSAKTPGAQDFQAALVALLRDWGTGLDLLLYEEALVHLLGGDACVLADVEVRTSDHKLGHQKMRLAAPGVAFCLTALPEPNPDYESHARRLLRHTELEAIHWANIALGIVTFTAIT
jgi:GxxExxY protein